MQAANNIFLTAGDPVKKYATTVAHPITGWRLDPDTGRQIEFVLTSPSKDEFSYEHEVIELYGDKEVKFFIQRNKYLIESGLVKEFTGTTDEVDTTNLLSDEEVMQIATIRQQPELKERLAGMTSKITVQRVLNIAKEIGRPAKIIALIESRLAELDD